MPQTQAQLTTLIACEQTFPRERPGLDYSLNWSLADDAITPRGDAFRNAEVNQIIMASAGKVDGNKGLLGALNTKPLKVFATDEIPNAETMDVEEFEVLSEQVGRSLAALGHNKPLCRLGSDFRTSRPCLFTTALSDRIAPAKCGSA